MVANRIFLADRVRGDVNLLFSERIQKVRCDGTDIFNMLPEVRYCDGHARRLTYGNALFLGIFCTFDPGLKRYIGLTMPTEF